METVYDWLTVALFAGLIVIFLERSTSAEAHESDSLLNYLVAGAGCALTNYLGNHGHDAFAILLFISTIGFVLFFIRPFGPRKT